MSKRTDLSLSLHSLESSKSTLQWWYLWVHVDCIDFLLIKLLSSTWSFLMSPTDHLLLLRYCMCFHHPRTVFHFIFHTSENKNVYSLDAQECCLVLLSGSFFTFYTTFQKTWKYSREQNRNVDFLWLTFYFLF